MCVNLNQLLPSPFNPAAPSAPFPPLCMLASPLQLMQWISCVFDQCCPLHRTRYSRLAPASVGKEGEQGRYCRRSIKEKGQPAQQFYTALSYNGRGVLERERVRERERASGTSRGLAAVQVDPNCLVKRKLRRQQFSLIGYPAGL